MASNPISGIFKVKDLRDRILFTLGLLLVYRLGVFIPVPGIDPVALKGAVDSTVGGAQGIAGYLDFFAGGALSQVSIFAMGIMPYISMSIVMQLLMIVFPALKRTAQEEGGKKKIQRYTRYGTILLSALQTNVVVQQAMAYHKKTPGGVILIDEFQFFLVALLTITTGTMFLMWIGEQINQRGIGNGISLLIFTGIVARMPQALWTLGQAVKTNPSMNPIILLLVFAMFVGVIALVIYEQQGQRKIPVHYAKRVVGRKMYGSNQSYIPFKINPSGVIPVIFASSLLNFPLQLLQSWLGPDVAWLNAITNNNVIYNVIYVILIIFFAYFYTQVSLNPVEISRQIRENGGSIPGIRSEKMEEYLTRVLTRIVLPGSIFLAFIAVIPQVIIALFNFPPAVAYLMGGTSLLIIVGVDLDLMSQIEGHLRMHHQDGLTKKGKIRSRNL